MIHRLLNAYEKNEEISKSFSIDGSWTREHFKSAIASSVSIASEPDGHAINFEELKAFLKYFFKTWISGVKRGHRVLTMKQCFFAVIETLLIFGIVAAFLPTGADQNQTTFSFLTTAFAPDSVTLSGGGSYFYFLNGKIEVDVYP